MAADGRSSPSRRAIRTCRLIENERLITPAALNLAIRASNGAYLLWMSAHSSYETGYIQSCVEYAEVFQADNTGGTIVTVPRDDTVAAPYIVAALTSRFGVGDARFRFTSGDPRWTDTVFGGCYRRDVFERIGLFNEALVRGQDMEFNLRLRRAGLRTLLVPTIHSVYHARTRVGEFARHNWTNGVWAILPWLHVSHRPVAWRHLVPLVFVTAMTIAVGLAVSVQGGWWPLAAHRYGIPDRRRRGVAGGRPPASGLVVRDPDAADISAAASQLRIRQPVGGAAPGRRALAGGGISRQGDRLTAVT